MTVHDTRTLAATATRRDMANAIRALAMDAVQAANSGHPGMPMGMADAAVALFADHVNLDPSEPGWPDRDRFVLSAGHGSMLQYAIHHLLGYADMGIDQVKRFRQLGSTTPGHPEYGHTLGVETTTGPLGQGLATAVGMALAERMAAARFGKGLVDHFTYVIAGDGCLQEGISHEAIDLAGHLKLSRLVVLWDDNRISIDGATSLSTSMDQMARFRAARWHVQAIDGHDIEAVSAAIARAKASPRPSLIACRTTIGKGAPNMQGSEKVHGAPLGAAEIAATRANIGWSHEPFSVPVNIVDAWRTISARGKARRLEWEGRLAGSSRRKAFEAAMSGDLPTDLSRKLAAFRKEHVEKATKVATRKASEMALGVVNDACANTVGGSADLTHSNLTLTKDLKPVQPGKYKGRYIHYGIREHAMAAAINGIALHGGFIPYGGTFLTFADYARGAMRLSALMGVRAIYVMTHDSIGLGEDGPTHQPVEHLAMLRATPNLDVFRPADIAETAEAWECALANRERPTVLVLSRQALPSLRERHVAENLSAKGGYVLHEPKGGRDVTLLATGSEAQVAMAAAKALEGQGVRAAVVSMPSFAAFERQDAAYRERVLGTAPRIAVEAAMRFGWDRWIGEGGDFIGMNSFGASAPAEALYEHFAITPAAVAARALELAGKAKAAR